MIACLVYGGYGVYIHFRNRKNITSEIVKRSDGIVLRGACILTITILLSYYVYYDHLDLASRIRSTLESTTATTFFIWLHEISRLWKKRKRKSAKHTPHSESDNADRTWIKRVKPNCLRFAEQSSIQVCTSGNLVSWSCICPMAASLLVFSLVFGIVAWSRRTP